MPKLCDRCRVNGCLLNYLGEACEKARREESPETQPNRHELLADMDTETAAKFLSTLVDHVLTAVPAAIDGAERAIPDIKVWLEEVP